MLFFRMTMRTELLYMNRKKCQDVTSRFCLFFFPNAKRYSFPKRGENPLPLYGMLIPSAFDQPGEHEIIKGVTDLLPISAAEKDGPAIL